MELRGRRDLVTAVSRGFHLDVTLIGGERAAGRGERAVGRGQLVDESAVPRLGPGGEAVVVDDGPGSRAQSVLLVGGLFGVALTLGPLLRPGEEPAEEAEGDEHEERLVPTPLMGEHHAVRMARELGGTGACCTLML